MLDSVTPQLLASGLALSHWYVEADVGVVAGLSTVVTGSNSIEQILQNDNILVFLTKKKMPSLFQRSQKQHKTLIRLINNFDHALIIAKFVYAMLDLRNGMKVVDLGCGTGYGLTEEKRKVF